VKLQVVETLLAVEERIAIAEYIGRRTSIEMARKFLRAMEAAYETLAEMPRIGSEREYRNPELKGLRMWPVPRFPNHLIFYIVSESKVEIIRVLHGARDIPTILELSDDE
jgi:toxin ParE1/3/4